MNERTDPELLNDYAERRSEGAFAELVRRHVDFVYSAALRMVRDRHMAEDVTQAVFLAFARNAGGLSDRPAFSGWLHRTTQNLAANAVRSDVRRRAREQEAAAMNEPLSAESCAPWEQIAPHLDDALGALKETEREAVLLRYFQSRSAREIGQSLGISEEAAQKRVNRAVERLRGYFTKRGVAAGTTAGLVTLLSAEGVQSAPGGLSAAIFAATASAFSEAAIHATLTATTKAIAMTTIQKAFIAGTITIITATGIYEAHSAAAWRSETAMLRQEQMEQAARQKKQTGQEREDALAALAALKLENAQLRIKLAGLKSDSELLAQMKAEDEAAAKDPAQGAMLSWLDRVERLKHHLEITPGARIPEMQFLNEQDWLNAAHDNLDSNDDYRRAMSSLRNTAENDFMLKAWPALQKYLAANNGAFPTDVSQLQPYFDSPMDAAILQRWDVIPASQMPNMRVGEGSVITQKSGVDEEMDNRMVMGSQGYGSMGGGFDPLTRTLQGIAKAYTAANPGKQPSGLSDLAPYATTPEQQAALNKAMRRPGWK